MNALKIIKEAELLIENGQEREAKIFLLKEGFEKKLDERIQRAYYKIISESKQLIKEKDSSLKDLFSKDDIIRIKAAKYIFNKARKEFSWEIGEWLGDPRTIDILFLALEDPNEKVVAEITGALWMISNKGRYFTDLRIYPKLIELLNYSSIDVVFYAALGLCNFSIDSKWHSLMDKLEITKNLKLTQAILKNIYIKSSIGVWGEITKEMEVYIRRRLILIYDKKEKEEIKVEISKALSWMDKNL
jgi:hypothetical protein